MGLFDKLKKSFAGPAPAVAPRENSSDPTTKVGSAASSPDSSGLLDRLKEKVCELSTGQLSADALDPEAALFDFGYLDSLSAVTMIGFIESEFGVTISEIDLVEELDHLRAIADRIARDRTR